MTSLALQVAASSGDAKEVAAGTVTLTDAQIGLNLTTMWAGLHLPNVTIPPGSTIDTAVLSIYHTTIANDSPSFNVYCQDSDNAATFSTAANDISSRPRTTATVTITAADVGTGWYAFPDMAAVVQEVIDRPGWASGNGLAVILDCITGVNCRFEAYDTTPSNAAKLDITYTAPGSAVGPLVGGKLVGHSILKGRLVR